VDALSSAEVDEGPDPLLLIVTGATASGKTALSLPVAERLSAEIVSADSRQVYRGMDIGTAKPTAAERARVPHHGLDVVDPDQRYSAGRFSRDARGWIRGIRDRGRIPLVVGGTGFFLKALTEPLFAEPELDEDRRSRLRAYLRRQPRARLEAWARWLDPDRADLAAEGGPQRLARTLEVALLTGRPLSSWHRVAEPEEKALPAVVVVVELSREEMDLRIEERVSRMVAAGWVGEVEDLVAAGYGRDAPGMSAVGYREILAFLEGRSSLDEAAEAIRRNTRRYARRQLTWFRNQLPRDTVRVDALAPMERQIRTVVEAWNGRRVAERMTNEEAGQ
jgi:tRNA dimethylallyltransferase